MSGKKKSGAWKAAKSIAAVLLTVAFAGGTIAFIGAESGLALSYNGTTYSAGESVRLPPAREYTFGIEKPLGIVKKIGVKVTANPESTLKFTADGKEYAFYTGDETADDYTGYFGITAKDRKLRFTIPDNATLKQALRYKYGTEKIELIGQSGEADFILAVTSGEKEISFTFSLPQDFSLTLTPKEIVF